MWLATDKASNSRQMALVYELKNVSYKKSTIAIPESFLHFVSTLARFGKF